MSTTTAANFSELIEKAHSGEYKLPAFQRKWKWTKKQVMSLYESLRQGYPVGSFLFMTSDQSEKLNPRSFYGSKRGAEDAPLRGLVLDGQQRITAGISLYYGVQETGGAEYYINVQRVMDLLRADKVDLQDEKAVKRFCMDLDTDDGYIASLQKRADRTSQYNETKLLWTALLTKDKEEAFDELVEGIASPQEKKILRGVIRPYFRADFHTPVPIISLDSSFDLSAVSRVFTTINTTGKLLTPFELVVAILYADDIRLEEDVKTYREERIYYPNMDRNGEVLLQTIALLANKPPKKSDLPKHIDADIYRSHKDEALLLLEELGEWLTNALGVGLDDTHKYIPYDSIYAPMALVLKHIKRGSGVLDEAKAKKKLQKWFVGAALDQRYQEGVHNKQSSDVKEFKEWIDADGREPSWLKDVRVGNAISRVSPSGAIGKLFLCLINNKSPKDPVKNETIGFRDKLAKTEVHHVFPTKWVAKGLVDFAKDRVNTHVALNTMLLSKETNGDWLNFDPADQIGQARKVLGDQSHLSEIYNAQFISDEAIKLLEKPKKTCADYDSFLALRYARLLEELGRYGFKESDGEKVYDDLSEVAEPAEPYGN